MRIIDFNATKKEIEISLSGWTRIGYISREINLSDNSYDEKNFDYSYSLSIKQIGDFETIQSKINGSLSTNLIGDHFSNIFEYLHSIFNSKLLGFVINVLYK